MMALGDFINTSETEVVNHRIRVNTSKDLCRKTQKLKACQIIESCVAAGFSRPAKAGRYTYFSNSVTFEASPVGRLQT